MAISKVVWTSVFPAKVVAMVVDGVDEVVGDTVVVLRRPVVDEARVEYRSPFSTSDDEKSSS